MAKSNFMEVKFKALSINEGFARICVAGFCVQLNPSIDELDDIKTSVSEAVTNCVVHAYPDGEGEIFMRCEIEGDSVKIIIKKPKSLFIRLSLTKKEAEWVLLLWKVLWMVWKLKKMSLVEQL